MPMLSLDCPMGLLRSVPSKSRTLHPELPGLGVGMQQRSEHQECQPWAGTPVLGSRAAALTWAALYWGRGAVEGAWRAGLLLQQEQCSPQDRSQQLLYHCSVCRCPQDHPYRGPICPTTPLAALLLPPLPHPTPSPSPPSVLDAPALAGLAMLQVIAGALAATGTGRRDTLQAQALFRLGHRPR